MNMPPSFETDKKIRYGCKKCVAITYQSDLSTPGHNWLAVKAAYVMLTEY
jgi:hypothetical protein